MSLDTYPTRTLSWTKNTPDHKLINHLWDILRWPHVGLEECCYHFRVYLVCNGVHVGRACYAASKWLDPRFPSRTLVFTAPISGFYVLTDVFN